ncbi:hypothetical protein SAMN04244572_03509 [Azotobacter beijerinckii]|uniref:Uncharacterized protein n=2 Tax=Azotobacter beijerinckii TaxID=170623 RepID=A0A1H6XR38_9GAMM|nr:hypothetical protein SAMN04244572_03509 [Azotobacter beijerinckii]
MRINFSPVRSDMALTATKSGDILTVNGAAFDFSQLPDGATLPAEAIGSPLFCGPVERVGGELHVTLLLPHGPNPSQAQAFPQPVIVTADGQIPLPAGVAEEEQSA